MTKDGITTVQGRATDEAGTVSTIASITLKIDTTKPRVAVSGITQDARLDVATVLTAQVTLADATSGVAERVTRLDGEVVTSSARIDASSLRSGKHVLEVLVRDEAGNLASRVVTFTVVATHRGAKALVDRFAHEHLARALEARL